MTLAVTFLVCPENRTSKRKTNDVNEMAECEDPPAAESAMNQCFLFDLSKRVRGGLYVWLSIHLRGYIPPLFVLRST